RSSTATASWCSITARCSAKGRTPSSSSRRRCIETSRGTSCWCDPAPAQSDALEAVAQRRQLGLQRRRNATVEGVVELLGQFGLAQPRLTVDGEQLVEIGLRHLDAGQVQILAARQASDRRLDRKSTR